MKKYFKALFYSGGKPQPVYLYIFVLMGLVIAMVVMRMLERGNFSDTLILGMCGFIVAWAGVITHGRIKFLPPVQTEDKNEPSE